MEAMAVKAALAEVETPMVCPWAKRFNLPWDSEDYSISKLLMICGMLHQWGIHQHDLEFTFNFRTAAQFLADNLVSLGGDFPAKNTKTWKCGVAAKQDGAKSVWSHLYCFTTNFMLIILVRNQPVSQTRRVSLQLVLFSGLDKVLDVLEDRSNPVKYVGLPLLATGLFSGRWIGSTLRRICISFRLQKLKRSSAFTQSCLVDTGMG